MRNLLSLKVQLTIIVLFAILGTILVQWVYAWGAPRPSP